MNTCTCVSIIVCIPFSLSLPNNVHTHAWKCCNVHGQQGTICETNIHQLHELTDKRWQKIRTNVSMYTTDCLNCVHYIHCIHMYIHITGKPLISAKKSLSVLGVHVDIYTSFSFLSITICSLPLSQTQTRCYCHTHVTTSMHT